MVKTKSGQKPKVVKTKCGQNQMWSKTKSGQKLKAVKTKSGQNQKWSKTKVVKTKSGQNHESWVTCHDSGVMSHDCNF